MFMYTLRKFSDVTKEYGNALGADDVDALLQIQHDWHRSDKHDVKFKLSDDPQSDYFMEKRIAYRMRNGYISGWRGPIDTVYVSG